MLHIIGTSTTVAVSVDMIGVIYVSNYATGALICTRTLGTYNSASQKIWDAIALNTTTNAANYILVATQAGKIIEVSYIDCSLRRSWMYSTSVLKLALVNSVSYLVQVSGNTNIQHLQLCADGYYWSGSACVVCAGT
jgi:hypothetical protein